MEWRALWAALRGRLTAFYMPSDIAEFNVVADLTSGSNEVDIESVNYSRYLESEDPWQLLYFGFTDGTFLLRTVSSASTTGEIDTLALTATWPQTYTVAEIDRVEIYDLHRFDSDELALQYDRIGLARARLPTVRVFDDDVS